MSKHCKPCSRLLPTSAFNKRAKSADGLCVICRECSADRNRKWREKNPKGFKDWAAANQDKRAASAQRWDAANRDRKSANYRRWAAANKGKVYARNAERLAAKIRAMPAWAEPEKINAFYEEAVRRTKETGVWHEVDHYFPLRGESVCGLHVETNLQILTRSQNAKKKNHMPRANP